MKTRIVTSRWTWLGVGLLAGLCIAWFRPAEPVAAMGNDRDSKFGMLTTPMGSNIEGVFVLDYVTGQLSGGVLNSNTGRFTSIYRRSIAADFNNVDAKARPHYAFVAGQAVLNSNRWVPSPGASVIYVAELKSGRVVAYACSFPKARGRTNTPDFVPIGNFQFREATLR